MDQALRNKLQRTTQDARRLLEQEFAEQLEGTYDILPDGTILPKPGKHLDEQERLTRQKLVDAVQHIAAGDKKPDEAVADYTREAAFTFLNRFVALKMLESRSLLQPCISKGDQSSGFKEFTGLAPGLAELPDKGYRLYLECLFDELSVEVKVLFDRRDVASLLWPRQAAVDGLLAVLNDAELAGAWDQDETIGWVYQYFNSQEERRQMREESQAPRNSRELAVRNQFFTPRYVVEFLTDNTLGRIWYEMRQGVTCLKEQCRYLVRRPDEAFLEDGDSEEVKAAAQWLQGQNDAEPDLWALADTVNGYHRAGEAGKANNAWVEARLPRLRTRESAEELNTQELLDMLFLFCRKERFCEGAVEALKTEIDNATAVLRERVAATRKEDASQEELLRQPVFIPFRAKKDPRDLKILDPACGSGHFLLYCFDLLLIIYEEAWADEQSPASEATGKTLREDYPTLERLRADVPGLILRHNLHGIDIDARCAQIAAFALWMRAQREYNDMGIARGERPAIRKTNIVVAEPMPGEKDMLDEFLRNLREDRLEGLMRRALNVPEGQRVRATKAMADSLCELVQTVWDKMRLAGEAGSLLKIEEELASIIEHGREEWGDKLPLFRVTDYDLSPEPSDKYLAHMPGLKADFWGKAESLVLGALREYAENKVPTGSYRRHLFADDAAQAFAFIELCRLRYDAVLMNPPFGAASTAAKAYLVAAWPRSRMDLYAAFVEMGLSRCASASMLGAITSRTGLLQSSFAQWRESVLLRESQLCILADLGLGVLDSAMVRTAAYCLETSHSTRTVAHALFARVLDAPPDSKRNELLRLVHHCPTQLYPMRAEDFRAIPGAPFNYWVPTRVRQLYLTLKPLDPTYAEAARGVTTCDDFRFLRLHWEVPSSAIGRTKRWCWFAKGGEFSPFYADIPTVIDWNGTGAMLRSMVTDSGRERARFRGQKNFYRAGLTYPNRNSLGFNTRPLPADCIISHVGQAIFPAPGVDPFALLGITNSKAFELLLKMITSHRKWEVGSIQRTPLPDIAQRDTHRLSTLSREAVHVRASLASYDETSHWFVAPLPLHDSTIYNAATLEDLLLRSCLHLQGLAERLQQITQLINTEVWMLYGVRDIDIAAMSVDDEAGDVPDNDDNEGNDGCGACRQLAACAPRDLCCDLISYAVGVAIGRWKLQRHGHWADPREGCRPFEPLPPSPRGTEANGGGPLSATEQLDALPDCGGTLVDDPGHPQDIIERICRVLSLVGNRRAEDGYRAAARILDVNTPDGDLRPWLRYGLFSDHIVRYTRSRRKAPIYWQLATPSASYSVWLYYHRCTPDTFYNVLNDYVKPKVEHELRKLDRMRAEAGGEPTRSQRAELDAQESFVADLKAFQEEIERIAPLWNPDLNDGVIINFAPLWRLVPQHRAWQKECRDCWDSLVAGEYDWSHLAMHLWPERVVPKCADDRSLAIAHDLEEVFWEPDESGQGPVGSDQWAVGSRQEGKKRRGRKKTEEAMLIANGESDEGASEDSGDSSPATDHSPPSTARTKWRKKRVTKEQIQALIAERTKPAVKAALESLLSAPAPGGNGKGRTTRRRGGRTS